MAFDSLRPTWVTGLIAAAALIGAPGGAVAQDDEVDLTAAPDARLTGVLKLDYYTHFVNYGYDTWDAGDAFGKNSTFNPSLTLNYAATDRVNVFAGVWGDVNDNASADILGADVQELDFWVGVDYTWEKFTFSVTAQYWQTSGLTEHILDFGIVFDDSEYLGDWAMYPQLTIHRTTEPQNGGDSGWAYVFGFGPAFTFNQGGDYPLVLSLPVRLGFGDSDFYYDAGFAYASVGAQASVPLTFISQTYGDWSLNFGLTYYLTDRDAIPANAQYPGDNPDGDYLVGNIGVAVAF